MLWKAHMGHLSNLPKMCCWAAASSACKNSSPNPRYHLALQNVLPLLTHQLTNAEQSQVFPSSAAST